MSDSPRTASVGPPAPGGRDGRSYIVTEHYRGTRLDRFLQAMLPKLSRQRIQRAIRTRVETSWHAAPRPALRVVPGGEVLVRYAAFVEPDIPGLPRILHEDGELVVIDKPAGLLVHPTHSCRWNNLVHILRWMRPGERIALAHRLDRETSGLMLAARTVPVSRRLAQMFASGEITKTYNALVRGIVAPSSGTFDRPLGVARRLDVVFRRSAGGERPQPAWTDFRVLRRYARHTLLELRPRTGRRHQIRAHLAEAGHPVVGDKLYGTDDRFYLRLVREGLDAGMRERLEAPRQLLHAAALELVHPATGRPVRFLCPLPPDFERFLEALGPPPLPTSFIPAGAGIRNPR